MLNSVLSKYGFNAGCWYYLRVLWVQDGVSQKDLSDRAYVAENTTVPIVNAMLKEGLITRERDEIDRRKFNIFLTERGKSLEKEALRYVDEINSVALAGLDISDIRTCLKVLIHISKNVETFVKD